MPHPDEYDIIHFYKTFFREETKILTLWLENF